MSTDFPLPASEQIGFQSPSVLERPYILLRSALGVTIPALLDFGCIGLACTAGILLYELHRHLSVRDAWLLWAEISLKYGAAFVILAQAHHLYTQRATLLQVADTARVLKVSLYGLTLLSVGNYFTKAEMPRLLLTYFWAFVAVLVKATSRGPVFFRHQRSGQAGMPFVMLKFRSMYVDTPKYGRSPESTKDRRITPVGRFLRKTSLDELPQLLNVLTGDMSLVGPRPEMPYITETYIPLERRRLSVPQGLTGLWQLSGDRKFIIHEAIEYDLYYIENRGIFLDFAILLHTLFFAMNGL